MGGAIAAVAATTTVGLGGATTVGIEATTMVGGIIAIGGDFIQRLKKGLLSLAASFSFRSVSQSSGADLTFAPACREFAMRTSNPKAPLESYIC
ncbi:hypothetical protein V1291_005015 [Nitrobacteraceae bacterium AZCC 1564]